MINSTPAEYVFIRVCIFLLQAVTPLSVAFTAYDAFCYLTGQPWVLPTAFVAVRIWCAMETAFYFMFQLPYIASIQQEAQHPPLLPAPERRALFERVTKDVSAADLERHVRWWFKGAKLDDIGREGVKSWISWAFFEGRIENDGKDWEELEGYVARMEQMLGKRFVAGQGKARPMRLTLDPVDISYRSLVWYFCVAVVDFITYVRLCCNGYHHHRQSYSRFFTLFPLRPVALTARKRTPVKHVTYWHRPHTSKTSLPILFVHGIGIGLYPYVDFLRDLIDHVDDGHQNTEDDGQIGIIALEIMPVAFRITHAALPKEDMCNEIDAILRHHGFDRCVVVSHSYGTVLTTHMLHNATLQPKIASVVLVDPVCFLLHNPDVAYNFTVRKPTSANEWQLWYFASQDLGVAHTLGRRFFWSENVLWLEDLLPLIQSQGKRITVSLADRDCIADTNAVAKYLLGDDMTGDKWKSREWKGQGIEVLWNVDSDHGQVFERQWKRARLVKAIRKYSELG